MKTVRVQDAKDFSAQQRMILAMGFSKDGTDNPGRHDKSAGGKRESRDAEKWDSGDHEPPLPPEYLKFDAYFDPTTNPYLEPGQFHKIYPLDAFYSVQGDKHLDLQTARAKLAERQKRYAWKVLTGKSLEHVTHALSARDFPLPVANLRRGALKRLPFYPAGDRAFPDGRLLHLEFDVEPAGQSRAVRLVLAGNGELFPLNGRGPSILDINGRLDFGLSDEVVEEYLAFFCEHVHGEKGGFYIVEHGQALCQDEFPECLVIRAEDSRVGPALNNRRRRGYDPFDAFPVATVPHPVLRVEIERDGGWGLLGTVCYGQEIYRATFHVDTSGRIEMCADTRVPGCIVRDLSGPHWNPPEGELNEQLTEWQRRQKRRSTDAG